MYDEVYQSKFIKKHFPNIDKEAVQNFLNKHRKGDEIFQFGYSHYEHLYLYIQHQIYGTVGHLRKTEEKDFVYVHLYEKTLKIPYVKIYLPDWKIE